MLSEDAAYLLAGILPPSSPVLDVGSGSGAMSRFFSERGLKVTSIHYPLLPGEIGAFIKKPDHFTDFLEFDTELRFEGVWASHVLEHQTNPGLFLGRCRQLLEEGGWLAVTVPPLKNEVVGGHVTLWNAGVLLYQLVMAGFNCAEAKVRTYGYNVSVLVKRPSQTVSDEILGTKLARDRGDIERLSRYFPVGCRHQGFNGVIPSLNWSRD